MNDPKRLLIQMRATPSLATAAYGPVNSTPSLAIDQTPGVFYDTTYSPVPLPITTGANADFGFGIDNQVTSFSGEQTYLTRAAVQEDAIQSFMDAARADPTIVGVFADAQIQPIGVTCASGPIGTDQDVALKLLTARLHAHGFTGAGVKVAIVDTGVNLAYLRQHGKTPNYDSLLSYAPVAGQPLGAMPIGHGTMCAYDVCIAAPNCTLLDHPVLTSKAIGGSAMDGLLSDAIRAYSILLSYMTRAASPFAGDSTPRTLVVNNSWGMFHPSWDYPVGDLSNYSDNPQHPFHLIVKSLDEAGADILFAAGNCGRDCPDGRCRNVSDGIYGANSSPYVTCVAGVSVRHDRLGYSTQGPGRLEPKKPDISCYTHFAGSGVYPADGGTSAATPVLAGVVAAIRRRYPSSVVPPAQLRQILRETATPTRDPSSQADAQDGSFNYDYGYGIVNVDALIQRLEQDFPNA